MLNYIDLNDENNKTSFQTVSERENAEVVYEPQYLPKSAVYDETELSALIAFDKIEIITVFLIGLMKTEI